MTKARNIQSNGGSLALIIDNKDFENPLSVIPSDDGTGAGILIPTILIGKTDGEKLK